MEGYSHVSTVHQRPKAHPERSLMSATKHVMILQSHQHKELRTPGNYPRDQILSEQLPVGSRGCENRKNLNRMEEFNQPFLRMKMKRVHCNKKLQHSIRNAMAFCPKLTQARRNGLQKTTSCKRMELSQQEATNQVPISSQDVGADASTVGR
mmetsp:Transcript_31572/g.60988  ORF Transcript_31572/g.60988 Transcript_31572/m.60988 type:complete len:152 (-) Transcript_31572:530-985(-)